MRQLTEYSPLELTRGMAAADKALIRLEGQKERYRQLRAKMQTELHERQELALLRANVIETHAVLLERVEEEHGPELREQFVNGILDGSLVLKPVREVRL